MNDNEVTQTTIPKTAFSSRAPIRFRHADAAGVLFFGHIYQLAHDTYEDFISYLGYEWHEWFQNEDWAVPIRHSSSEYFLPMMPAQEYEIRVAVERMGKSSFTLLYSFINDDSIYCEVRLVHTFYNKKARTKMSVPSSVRERLEAYRSECLDSE